MEDVARRAGVSRALVSLVMREAPNVSDARRTAVLKAADELGYRPNVLARNLASRQTMTLGVMLNDLHNPFFAEAVDGIQVRADEHGYQLLLATGGTTADGERGAIETFLRFRVDGLILTGPRVETRHIVDAAKTTPTVLIGRNIRADTVDTVNNDERVGARLAVEHLVALGHQRIAHIDGGRGAGADQRKGGYELAMRAAGFEKHIETAVGDFTEASGSRAADRLFDQKKPPTAIFAANDLSAVGAVRSIENMGRTVPAEVSIVGYDNSSIAAMQHLSLTTVNQPREEMGSTAVDLLLERINDERKTAVRYVVRPDLVVRGSTGPVPNRKPSAKEKP